MDPVDKVSGKDVPHHMAMNIGQPIVTPLKFVSEMFVVDSKLVQDRGLKIVDVDGLFHGIHGQFVGSSIRNAGLDAAAGHPYRKRIWMVVATPLGAVVDISLQERSAPEFPPP